MKVDFVSTYFRTRHTKKLRSNRLRGFLFYILCRYSLWVRSQRRSHSVSSRILRRAWATFMQQKQARLLKVLKRKKPRQLARFFVYILCRCEVRDIRTAFPLELFEDLGLLTTNTSDKLPI